MKTDRENWYSLSCKVAKIKIIVTWLREERCRDRTNLWIEKVGEIDKIVEGTEKVGKKRIEYRWTSIEGKAKNDDGSTCRREMQGSMSRWKFKN